MRKSLLHLEVGPAILETIECGAFGDEESVLVGLIYPGESFDEIGGVSFITGQLSTD